LAAESLEKLRQESLHRAKEEQRSAQLRAIVESSDDAIVSKDLGGVITSWNRAAEKIFGYTAAEAIGQPIAMLLPPDRRHEESEILERIRRGGHVKHFETVRTCKGGKQIQVSLTVSPIFAPDGTLSGASHIARDITEKLEFDRQLRQTQKLESLGVLAGGLAHDFNNLLTGIMGNASLAADGLPPDHRVRSRIQEIVAASERAALLIRQMLAYAGKGAFVLEHFDISNQVEEIVPLLRTSIPRTIDLKLKLEGALPRIEADRSQIQQLIMNLAINAAESIEGAGTVAITTSARRSEAEQEVVLEVRDTGSGMDEEVRARIFDPFFTTKFTGRGLGLSAVMGIIRTHRGSISVESKPGVGSTFTVVFPAYDSPARAPAAEPAAELHGEGRILVVDDEELVRNMAAVTLQQYGYTVETATDGAAGVALFSRDPDGYGAVLLDLTMPVMDGDRALREIRAIRPEVPVLLSSGYSETDALARFSNHHFAGFLQKPYTGSALARKLKQLLRRRGGEPCGGSATAQSEGAK
jgi:PAS domain S-box-containing protein